MFENLFSMDGKYSKAMNWLWNVLLLSILWLLCCLPIITIGASSTAAYYTAAKVIRHKQGSVFSSFFSSFRSNFLQSVPLTVFFLVVFAVVLLECLLIISDESIPVQILYLFYGLALTVYAFSLYLWACFSRFSKTVFSYIGMSMILVFRHLLTTVLLLLLHGVTIAAVFYMPWGILVFPGVCLFLETYLMEKILLHYSPVVSEDDPEAEKWYYQ